MCGGSIIDNQYVLSAAHCTIPSKTYQGYEYVIDEVEVLAGLNNLNEDINSGSYSLHIADQIIDHPSYVDFYHFDITVLRVTPPFDFGSTARMGPICLPEPGFVSFYTEVFGSTGSVGRCHFVHYSGKSVTLDFLDFIKAKFQFGDC